ncbi:MAG: hypothetical protein KAS75_01095 [Planctomycetes bacterium]|nr:hypothetical protein [Planctomycetota bacterium]
MYSENEYIGEIGEAAPLYEQQEHTSDIPLPPGMPFMLLVAWAAICLVGFAAIFIMKQPVIGVFIIGIPTFIGMIIRPTFALCVFMLILPTGAGVAVEGAFTLNKGVGLALAASFMMNLLISRARLKMSSKALLFAVAYFVLVMFSLFINSYRSIVLLRLVTKAQYLGFSLIVYWILTSNTSKTLLWCLRSYVIGSLGTIALTFITGAAIRTIEAESDGRYTATLGNVINANHLSALVALALLASIYLIIKDKKLFWRLIYLIGILVLPIMLLKIGSRGTLVALTFTMISPLLFIRQVWQKPSRAILLVVFIAIVSLLAIFYIKSGRLGGKLEQRLTDVNYAKESVGGRMRFNRAAMRVATRQFAGTGLIGWFEKTSVSHYPHNDFFFILGIYGLPAASMWLMMMIFTMLLIRRVPLSPEKLYARSILFFLLMIGLKGMYIDMKFYWLFLAVIWSIERYSFLSPEQSEQFEYDDDVFYEGLPQESGL